MPSVTSASHSRRWSVPSVARAGVEGDRVWAIDYGAARYSVFDTAGAFLETRARRAGRSFVPWPGVVGPDAVHDFQLGAGDSLRIVRGSLDGRADTVAIAPFRPGHVPFEPEPLLAIDPRGVWLAEGLEYRLSRLDRSGETLRIVERVVVARIVGRSRVAG